MQIVTSFFSSLTSMMGAAWGARLIGGWLMSVGLGAAAEAWQAEAFQLAPEVELAWEAALKEARPLRGQRDTERMDKLIGELKATQGLDEKAVMKLKSVVPMVVAESVVHWEQFLRKRYRTGLQGPGDQGVAALNRLDKDLVTYMKNHVVTFYQRPEELDRYVKAVQEVLDEKAFTTWNERRLTAAKARIKEAEEWVARGVLEREPIKIYSEGFSSTLEEMKGVMKADAAGLRKMESQVAEWAKQYEKDCREASLLSLHSFSETGEGWSKAKKSGRFLSMPLRKRKQEKQIQELLSMMPPEAKAAHARLGQQRKERLKLAVVKARVMALELMTPLDEAQRKAVEALASALPIEKEEPILTPQVEPYPWRVWKTVEGAKRVYEILDDRQERLLAKGLARLEQGNSQSSAAEETQPVALRHPALGPADMTGVEAAISEHLAATSREQSLRGLETMLREVELVGRVVDLDEAAVSALELAAKGTAQRAAEAYRVNQGRYMRSQVQGATPDTIRERLRTVGGYSFYMGREGPTLVEETLDSLITDEQRKQVWAYQDEVKKRQKEAILLVLLARVDQALGLSEEQSATLAVKLQEVMEKYGPDIEQNFRGWGERVPWFLQGYYLMLPGAGLSDADLKAVLNERQMTLWDAEVTQRGGSYWAQVLEYHEQRKNRGRGSAVKRRIFFEQ